VIERDGALNETANTEVLYHSMCGTIKIPPCSKAHSAEIRLKFSSPSPSILIKVKNS
jgi:hypothetical protein